MLADVLRRAARIEGLDMRVISGIVTIPTDALTHDVTLPEPVDVDQCAVPQPRTINWIGTETVDAWTFAGEVVDPTTFRLSRNRDFGDGHEVAWVVLEFPGATVNKQFWAEALPVNGVNVTLNTPVDAERTLLVANRKIVQSTSSRPAHYQMLQAHFPSMAGTDVTLFPGADDTRNCEGHIYTVEVP